MQNFVKGLLCGLFTLTFVSCDQAKPQQNSSGRTISPKTLGPRPPLGKAIDGRQTSADNTFVSMVSIDGVSTRGVIVKDTRGSIGENTELGLHEMSCDIKSGTAVAIVGLEKSATPGNGLYLVQLREPCQVGRFALNEIYVEENAIYLVEEADAGRGTVQNAKNGSTEPPMYPEKSSTATATATATSTNTSTGTTPPPTSTSTSTMTSTITTTSTTTTTGKDPMDKGDSTEDEEPTPILEGCTGIAQVYLKGAGTTRISDAMAGASATGCRENCMIPGETWRAGGGDFAIKINGQADKLKVDFSKQIVNGVANPSCTGSPATPAPSQKFKGNFAFGDSNNVNCTSIPSKIVSASTYSNASSPNTFIVPLKDLLIANDWRGARITITVTALDTAGKPINICTQETGLASPIVLDFSNEATLSTVSIHDSKVRFDLLATGRKTRTGWIDGPRGFLAIDLNRDGVINHGGELFGEGTALLQGDGMATNGYEALNQYAVKGQDFIDTKTPAYRDLFVWFDRNQDGKSQNSEMVSLADLGITRIDTSYHEAPQYASRNSFSLDNEVKWRSKFYDDKNCQSGCYSYDVYFATESISISGVRTDR